MSNPNFVSDLVAMAKAFEELPEIKAQLEAKSHDHAVSQQMIQRLELRLIDLKTELDAAHAATRKVEVERDHAERMFLETDDRLNAFRRLLGSFQTEAGALIAAAEPTVEAIDEVKVGASEVEPDHFHVDDGGPYNEPQGERAVDPTNAADPNVPVHLDADSSGNASPMPSQPEAVSVQPYPTSVTTLDGTSANDVGSVPVEVSALQPEGTYWKAADEEAAAARPTDPTVAATPIETGADALSTGASENMTASADTTTEQPSISTSASVDDVGYHNEPKIASVGGAEAWAEWDKWCERMNRRYPAAHGGWPQRQQAAQ